MRMEQSNIFGAFQTHEQYQIREREKDNLILAFLTIRSQVFTDFDASSKTTHHIMAQFDTKQQEEDALHIYWVRVYLGSEDHRQGRENSSDQLQIPCW